MENRVTKVILIVDDEPANIDTIKNLIPAEYKCKAVTKGQIALKQINKQKPDMMILDLIMPGMNGIETLTEVRKIYSQTQLPTLIVSGTKKPEQFDALQTLGISGLITKPVDSAQFDTILMQTFGSN